MVFVKRERNCKNKHVKERKKEWQEERHIPRKIERNSESLYELERKKERKKWWKEERLKEGITEWKKSIEYIVQTKILFKKKKK